MKESQTSTDRKFVGTDAKETPMTVQKSFFVSILIISFAACLLQSGRCADKSGASPTPEKSDSVSRIEQLESLVKLAETALALEKQNDTKGSTETLKLIATTASVITNGDPSDNSTTKGADRNILKNPSFEAGDSTSADWETGQEIPGVTYLWDKQNGKTGKASVCITKTANAYFPIADWHQTVDCEPGNAALKITSQVKAENATKAIVDILFLDGNGQWVKHEWVSYIGDKKPNAKPITHDWKEYAGKVKIPPKTKSIQIGLQMSGPGKVWFDDLKVEYVK